MKSLTGQPNNRGPASLMKAKFIRMATDYGVFNPASRKKSKADQEPRLIRPPRSVKEARQMFGITEAELAKLGY